MSALLHDGESATSGSHGVESFQPPWAYEVNYVFPPSALVPQVLAKFLAEYVTCQYKLLSLVAACLMEDVWVSTVINMLEDISH